MGMVFSDKTKEGVSWVVRAQASSGKVARCFDCLHPWAKEWEMSGDQWYEKHIDKYCFSVLACVEGLTTQWDPEVQSFLAPRRYSWLLQGCHHATKMYIFNFSININVSTIDIIKINMRKRGGKWEDLAAVKESKAKKKIGLKAEPWGNQRHAEKIQVKTAIRSRQREEWWEDSSGVSTCLSKGQRGGKSTAQHD